ncbi:thioesterase domain-containing protein, partial [Streptomyces sp. NPDC005474]|uniref:thioesterase domain-containing protein n=1 Tax=Streptomyces sp. NPDC005474 TaxID=3154878 RepID=UPI0034531904
ASDDAVPGGTVSDGAVLEGAASDGAASGGAISGGAVSHGAASGGAVSDGAVPGSAAPDVTAPGGAASHGAASDGAVSDSAVAGGAASHGAVSGGAVSGGAASDHAAPDGAAPDGTAPATVPELAAAHVAALRGVRPHGPYHLAGWSLGGLLAYEMAHQLRADGEEVATLTLLDTAYPGTTDVPADETALLEWFHDDLARSAGADPDDAARDALRAALLAAEDTPARLRAVAAALAEYGSAPAFGSGELARHHAVFRTGLLAATRYRPPLATGPVHFHQSTTGAALHAADRWAGRVPDGLVRHDSDADHYALVRAPHVTAVAAHLDAALTPAGHRPR